MGLLFVNQREKKPQYINAQRCLGEHSFDLFIELLTSRWLAKEITEYWRTSDSDS